MKTSDLLGNSLVTLRLREKLLGRITIEAPIKEFLDNVQFVFPDQELLDSFRRGRLYGWGLAYFGKSEQATFIVKLTETPDKFLTTRRPRPGDIEVLVVITSEWLLNWIKTEPVSLDDLILQPQFPPMSFKENDK